MAPPRLLGVALIAAVIVACSGPETSLDAPVDPAPDVPSHADAWSRDAALRDAQLNDAQLNDAQLNDAQLVRDADPVLPDASGELDGGALDAPSYALDAPPPFEGVLARTWSDPLCAPEPVGGCVASTTTRVLDAATIVGSHAQAISDALNAAGAVTEVCLRAGVYAVDRPIVVTRGGRTLRGEGETTILRLAAGAYPIPERCNDPRILLGEPALGTTRLPYFDCQYAHSSRTRVGMVTLRADDVTVRDLTFDQNYRALGHSTDVLPYGAGSTPTSIYPRASSLMLAVNADLDLDGAADGVGRSRTSGATVENVTFLDHYGDAVSAFVAPANDVTVRGCRFASAYVVACDPRYASLREGTGITCWEAAGPGGEQAIAVTESDGFVIERNCIDGPLDDAIAVHRGTRGRIAENLVWTTGGRILIEGAAASGPGDATCVSGTDCSVVVDDNYIEYIESGGSAVYVTIVDQATARAHATGSVGVRRNALRIPRRARYRDVPITVEAGLHLFGAGDGVLVEGNRIDFDGASGTADCGASSPTGRCGRDFDAILLAPREVDTGLVYAGGGVRIVGNRVWSRRDDAFVFGVREATWSARNVGMGPETAAAEDSVAFCSVEARDNVFTTNVGVRLHLGASTGPAPSRVVTGNTCTACDVAIESTGLERSTGPSICVRPDFLSAERSVGCPLVGRRCPTDVLIPSTTAPCPTLPTDAVTLSGSSMVTVAPFVFAGASRTSAWIVAERGLVAFSALSTAGSGTTLPSSTTPTPMIAAFWPRRPLTSVSVRQASLGTTQLFEWEARTYLAATGTAVSSPFRFQVRLMPQGEVQLQACTSLPSGASAAEVAAVTGGDATFGFQVDGSTGETLSHRSAGFFVPGRVARILPTERPAP